MTTPAEAKLDAPGAGLPGVELFFGRMFFALQRWTSTTDSCVARFQGEREKIRRLLNQCDAEAGAQRVLIARPVGLEDSSRFWSVWMTLDHLRIVHLEFVRVIQALTAGKVPEGEASTAAVKPGTGITSSIVPAWEASCGALLAAAVAAPDLRTAVRFKHPWFGPLDAAGWHALAGGHLRIHRVQIQRILRALPAARREGRN